MVTQPPVKFLRALEDLEKFFPICNGMELWNLSQLTILHLLPLERGHSGDGGGVGRGDGDLERRDVEGRHVVLAAALVLVVDDVFPHVVVRVRVLDLRLATPVVDHEHQDQH